ncbi:MAG TPA: OsmC family protein [Balneolales bacterium]|nr:OsmC family protein [Balneolales bacterium]
MWPFGIHYALGGYHDAPNPGDLLCAALASCLDSTIRIIAERLRIRLTFLEVDITADVDLRGTLLVDRDVPVGFQKMRCKVNLEAEDGTDPKLIQRLLKASEHSCVNMQTLLSGISIETSLNGN